MLNQENVSKLTVADLKEGDIALIKYAEGNEHIVYVFRATSLCQLDMVSLSHQRYYWAGIKSYNIPVIKVFQPGEKLEVV